MSTATGINLATVGTAELEIMSEAVFKASLEQMSGEAIARFRRMRKLSSEHRQALEKYLVEHPEKRPGGDEPQPAQAPAKAGKSTNGAGKPAKPAEKRIGKSKPSPFAGLKLRLCAWWEGVDVKDLPLIDARRSKKALEGRRCPQTGPGPARAGPGIAARRARRTHSEDLGRRLQPAGRRQFFLSISFATFLFPPDILVWTLHPASAAV